MRVPDQELYPDYLPTYMGNTPLYEDAEKFMLDDDTTVYNIHIQPKPQQTTPYYINWIRGYYWVNHETCKKNFKLDDNVPLGGIWIYLINDEKDVIAYAVTDSTGEFMMDSIPAGIYDLYVNYMGLPMDTNNVSLTLDSTHTGYELEVVAGSTAISVTIKSSTSVEKKMAGKKLQVYPNPVRNVLFLKFDEATGAGTTVRLIGMDGGIYKTLRPGSQQAGAVLRIPVSGLTPGLYILSVEGERINYRHRIIIMR